jgi:hypothetical protein
VPRKTTALKRARFSAVKDAGSPFDWTPNPRALPRSRMAFKPAFWMAALVPAVKTKTRYFSAACTGDAAGGDTPRPRASRQAATIALRMSVRMSDTTSSSPTWAGVLDGRQVYPRRRFML